jgi:hypothetical protein
LTRVRLSFGWEGHDYLEVDPGVLARLIERLVDAGVVPSLGSPARDPRIRASEFLPDSDAVVEERHRVCASLKVLNRLGHVTMSDAEITQFLEFLGLTSFHSGFAVTYAIG